MSVWSTIKDFVETTVGAATRTVVSAERSLDIGNEYMENKHKECIRIFASDAVERVAVHDTKLAERLSKDVNLKAQFEKIQADW